jgi:serine/threonine protein phosphatase PrpC
LKWRVGLATRPLHDQDRSLVELDLGLFGVFDGVGAFARSGEAAELAAGLIDESCRAGDVTPEAAMMRGCERAEALIKQGALGATTATMAWVLGPQVIYLTVGDSRLYHLPAGATCPLQVTVDEGVGNLLYNALGEGPERGGDPVATQRGNFPVASGDKLLLVTDGITGDFAPDLLSAHDLGPAIAGDDPQRAAQRLIEIARKRDDRTALVIFLD